MKFFENEAHVRQAKCDRPKSKEQNQAIIKNCGEDKMGGSGDGFLQGMAILERRNLALLTFVLVA